MCTSVCGAWMMSCSVRKKGPKWVSKYSFSRRAWLLGADHRSTGLVVTRMNTRPEEQAAMKAREEKTTQLGFRTQKEPHLVKSRLKQPSNAAPSGSQQEAAPGGEGGLVRAGSFLNVGQGKHQLRLHLAGVLPAPPRAPALSVLPAHRDRHAHPTRMGAQVPASERLAL